MAAMSPFRAISSTAGCVEKTLAWGVAVLFAGAGVRLVVLAPTQTPAWAAAGLAVACLLTATLAVWAWALGRDGKALGLLWFLYLAAYLVALALFFPR